MTRLMAWCDLGVAGGVLILAGASWDQGQHFVEAALLIFAGMKLQMFLSGVIR